MSEEPTPAEIQNKIRELLGRATLQRARGNYEDALKLTQEAVVLDRESWESHELMGDLLLELKRADQALESYRTARQLNERRPLLEEKIGRAALARAARLHTAEMSRALLEGKAVGAAPKRSPAYAALFSLIVPGLGQVYNTDVFKGLILAVVWLALFGLNAANIRVGMSGLPSRSMGSLYGPQIDIGSIAEALFSGAGAIWFGLLVIVWIYAVADAAVKASRTMTSDSTGIV
jgi:tetratricopeptide (TPR) repeat protein